MSIVVEDILECRNWARGTFRLQRDWIDLVIEVQAAVSACSWAVAGYQHSLCMQVPHGPVYGYVDPVLLRQMVAGFVENVCRHSPAVLDRVHVVLERIGDEAVLSIAPENACALSSEATIDLDSGLDPVRELVQTHGGSIEVRSVGAGRGNVFVARLPLGYSSLRTQIA
jgi:signal transduction histidine kinase